MKKSAQNTTPIEVLAAQFFHDHRDQFRRFIIMQAEGLLISWKDMSGTDGHIAEMEDNKGHYRALNEDDTTQDLILRLGIPRKDVTFVGEMTLTETPPPGRSS